ncbi:MAG: rane protein required for colicin production [Sphingomonadales bacterium]|jgi:membrane protein required for colicin V production|nr:rane protein required for colicin production [Sphingomonadales bacterium]MEA3043287.1 rane protein required for colicin production [Sphingomonadales bacterium]MEA3047897.1 rane protein required for colicin production [Sphingomonadales bacterium]
MGLTALDILVVLLVGGGLVLGWLRGFVAEILSLFAWFLAIIALRYLHGPVRDLLTGPVGTVSGASVLAFALVFGLVFLGGKLASRRLGGRVRNSVVGPLDRVLGAGFGALKGLILATLLFLAVNLVYDTIWGRAALRPDWMADARTYPLLKSSGTTIVDLVEAQRGPAANQAQANSQNAQ